jgi:hypothetical protein
LDDSLDVTWDWELLNPGDDLSSVGTFFLKESSISNPFGGSGIEVESISNPSGGGGIFSFLIA